MFQPKLKPRFSAMSSRTAEKRREARYPLEVEAIIFCGGEYFSTQTLNMSSSGLQLKHPVPARFEGKPIEIQVASDMANPTKYQIFSASVVGELRNRLHFLKEIFA